MHELFEGIELSAEQTEWICRGLLDLAAVDGVDESELALIADFYAGDADNRDGLAALQAKPFDLAEAARVLGAGGRKVSEAFLTSAYLLIYADGRHSDEERTRVAEFAAAFGFDPERQEEVHLRARLYLLRALAENLRNRATVNDIAASMGVDAQTLDRALEK